MNNKYQKYTWIWPHIEDAESAKKAARQGDVCITFYVRGDTLFPGVKYSGF